MIEIDDILDVKQHIYGLKVIILDLDDTLYSEKEYIRSGYHAVAQLILSVENAEAKLWQAFKKKKSAIDEVLINEGIYTEELKQKCLEAYRHHSPNIRLYDGVEKMLVTFRKQGLAIGIITDGRPEGQHAKIKALNLKQYVDHIIVTDELGGIEYRKPNEKAFSMAREFFGVDYSEMCYVGDNISKDFLGPEELGMKCIWFNNMDGIYCDKIKK